MIVSDRDGSILRWRSQSGQKEDIEDQGGCFRVDKLAEKTSNLLTCFECFLVDFNIVSEEVRSIFKSSLKRRQVYCLF